MATVKIEKRFTKNHRQKLDEIINFIPSVFAIQFLGLARDSGNGVAIGHVRWRFNWHKSCK